MNVLRKIFGKTKIDRIRNQGINEWVERRRREWDEYATRMDADRIVKISSDNIPAGTGSPDPSLKTD